MVGNPVENNQVTIAGEVISRLEYNHELYGESFYTFVLEVPRLSNSYDKIPVIISERLFDKGELKEGCIIEIEGQFRSYNNYEKEGNRLVLIVFVREMEFLENESKTRNCNLIYLNGYVCKKPIYRTTPFGREITDLLIAVNRPYNKSDYIPCIAWGRNARFSQNLSVGDNIKLWGRIQSREYQKKYSPGDIETKTAYEVSISKMKV